MKSNEMLGAILLSEINIAYYQELIGGTRQAIAAGRFGEFASAVRAGWAVRGDMV
jgi:queuine tRNA-ribosyltransferase